MWQTCKKGAGSTVHSIPESENLFPLSQVSVGELACMVARDLLETVESTFKGRDINARLPPPWSQDPTLVWASQESCLQTPFDFKVSPALVTSELHFCLDAVFVLGAGSTDV